jgi:hypothetical protein
MSGYLTSQELRGVARIESIKQQIVAERKAASLGQATDRDISEGWEAAKQDVERDLRSPAFRKEMWDLARELEKKIPWDIDYTS